MAEAESNNDERRTQGQKQKSSSSSSSSSSPWAIAGTSSSSGNSGIQLQQRGNLSSSASSSSIPSQSQVKGQGTKKSSSGPRLPNDHSSSSTSSSSGSKPSNIVKVARARVSMACVHCRQRKIRCDGAQPTCSTCLRLGRLCVYESITEMENVFTREKKRRSKEVKQGRLKSLQGIGIAIPPQSGTSTAQRGPSSIGDGGGESSGSGTARYLNSQSMGVIRDSRLARQERNRPYSHSSMQPPDQPQQQQQQQIHRIPSVRRTASGTNTLGRRRNVTTDTPTSVDLSLGRIDTGAPPIAFTSLSQPTTPEATYSMHASNLSRELASQQGPMDIIPQPTSAPFYNVTVHPSSLDKDAPPIIYRGGPFGGQSLDYTPSPTYPSGDPSTSSRSSAGDATIATSISSLNQPAQAHSSSPSTMQRFMSENHGEDLEAQLALRRRSSFDVGDFWRRTSVADAAVANFFDRVIQARGARKSSAESVVSPSLQRFAVPESPSYASTLTAHQMREPSDAGEMQPYTPVYGGSMQQVFQGPAPLPYSGMGASPEQLSYAHHTDQYHRQGSEEQQQQLQLQQQQQQWQQEQALHSHGQQPLHLGHLPDFQSYRQFTPLNTAGSNSSGSHAGNNTNLHSSEHFTPPHPLSSGLPTPGFSYLTPPIPNIAPPPLPTPMTELSSNMFAMGAPSHISSSSGSGSGYHIPTYFTDESGQLHQHQQQQMAAFVSSRHGSLSSNSIPEEEGEGEEHRAQR